MNKSDDFPMIAVDYAIDILCDASHPQVRVAQPIYVAPTGIAAGFLRWRAARLPERPDEKLPLETYFGLIREGVSEDSLISRSGDEMEGTRWNLKCPECSHTVPVRGSRAERIFDSAMELGVKHLPLSGFEDL